jgi:hypothetical protein
MPSPGEVVDEAPAVLLPDEISAEPIAVKPIRPIAKVAPKNQPVDVIAQVRERLQFVRERIAELRVFEKEERRLDRMLSVIDADDVAAE